MNRFLLPVLGAALALGACNPHEASRTGSIPATGPRYASLDASLDPRTDAVAGPSAAARPSPPKAGPVAVLPAWIGRPLRLREHDDAETFEQVISLDRTPRGETRDNLVMVSLPRSRAASERLVDGSVGFMAKPTEAAIRSELEAVFPGTPMQVVTRPAKNSYGAYGLAIGRTGQGARCLYAWQWIEEAPALEPDQRAGLPLSLRVRLCRSDVTLEAMAAAVNQLRLVPRAESTPLASSAPASPAPGRHRARQAVRHAAGHAAQPAARVARAAPEPMPVTTFAPQPAPVRQAMPEVSGRRFLGADSGPLASPPAAAQPVAATAMRATLAGLGGPAPAARAGLAADLPPEAYRGPAGSSGNRP